MNHNSVRFRHVSTRLIALLCLMFCGIASYAQKEENTSPIQVANFEKVQNGIMDTGELNDENGKLDMKKYKDKNNKVVCLVKVKAQGFDESILKKVFFVPRSVQITHKTFKNGEWYLYVSSETSGSIKIKYQGDCIYKLPYQLEPKTVYDMTLTMETATLTIHAIPADAEIFVDDSLVGQGQAIVPVPIGSEHRYRVQRVNCYAKEETVRLEKSEKQKEINVELETNFGYISVSSIPSEADVYIDENKVGMTPYLMKEIATGDHVVELRRTGFKPVADRVTIEKGMDNKQLANVELEKEAVVEHEPDSGFITIRTEPTGARIFVDDVFVGETPYTARKISFGVHAIKIEKKEYEPVSEVVLIEKENPHNTQLDGLRLQKERVRTGKLNVVTIPPGARISIDGMSYGLISDGPFELQVGEHTVSLSLFGYENAEEVVEIRDSETTEHKVKLEEAPKGHLVVISTPSDASVKVDGRDRGKTPCRIDLPSGEYVMSLSLYEYYDMEEKVKITEGVTDTLKLTLKSCNIQSYSVNGVTFNMVKVKGGTFSMGATGSDGEADESPRHEVTLNDFYIGQFEVTQNLWEAVMGKNPSWHKGKDLPVERVSWDDCQEFIKKLNEFTGMQFRLPTEAEWEYAARGGFKSKEYKYSGSNNVEDVAWYKKNSGRRTHSVGSKSPNEIEVYDMTGNVWEWCQDWYGEKYYKEGHSNGRGPKRGSYRVRRGGDYRYDEDVCRVSNRGNEYPSAASKHTGLRLCM